MSQLHSQSESLSLNAYSSRGLLCKISQQMCKSIEQGLVSPILMGYAAKVESLFESAFLFKVSYDSYLQTEECTRQPLAFMADEMGDTMFSYLAMNHPNA